EGGEARKFGLLRTAYWFAFVVLALLARWPGGPWKAEYVWIGAVYFVIISLVCGLTHVARRATAARSNSSSSQLRRRVAGSPVGVVARPNGNTASIDRWLPRSGDHGPVFLYPSGVYSPTMRENTLKQRLNDGKPAFGVMCTFLAPAVVEMLGHLGF